MLGKMAEPEGMCTAAGSALRLTSRVYAHSPHMLDEKNGGADGI